MSNDSITVRKRRTWSAVPDDVLEHPRLSLRARAVLGWMLGRADGWVIQVEHMLRVLRMTEYVWASVRSELQEAGYYRQTRVRQANGTITWIKDVLDPPEQPSERTRDGENHPWFRQGWLSRARCSHAWLPRGYTTCS